MKKETSENLNLHDLSCCFNPYLGDVACMTRVHAFAEMACAQLHDKRNKEKLTYEPKGLELSFELCCGDGICTISNSALKTTQQRKEGWFIHTYSKGT